MALQDKILTCVECGKEFAFTAGEQEFFAQKGFTNEPKRCKGCKAMRTRARVGKTMAKFTKLDRNDVVLGRGRAALVARKPYVEAIKAGQAGKIEIDRGERPATVKRLLQEASKETGVRVRSSWEDSSQRVLLWKRTGR